MKKGLRLLAVAGLMVFSLSSFMPAKNVFTAAEQQQVSIATPGCFAHRKREGIFLSSEYLKVYIKCLTLGKETGCGRTHGVLAEQFYAR